MTQYVKVRALTAQSLLDHFELYDEKADLCLVRDTAPQISIERLADSGFFLDAIKLLAHGLPKREAIWWSCLASRSTLRPETDEFNHRALLAAESWARKPSEENRLICKDLSEKTQLKTSASWAATAATWCSGSMAPEGDPVVPPPEYLYAHAVSGAILLAAAELDPEKIEQHYRHFLDQGINLACGGNGLISQQ